MKKDAFICRFMLGECLGESLARNELFIFFCILLQRFTFRDDGQGKLPHLEGKMEITLSPSGYLVVLESK